MQLGGLENIIPSTEFFFFDNQIKTVVLYEQLFFLLSDLSLLSRFLEYGSLAQNFLEFKLCLFTINPTNAEF